MELLNAHSHPFQAHHLFFANFPTESPRSIHDARWTHHHSTSYNVYEKKSSKDQQSAPVQREPKARVLLSMEEIRLTSWGPVVYPTIYRVLYIPSGLLAGFLFTINSSICSCYVTRYSNHEINESDGNGTTKPWCFVEMSQGLLQHLKKYDEISFRLGNDRTKYIGKISLQPSLHSFSMPSNGLR